MGERGQITPLVALAVLAAAGACIGLGRLGGAVVAEARADTAADAAALAGATGGRGAAARAARANGGRLVGFEQAGRDTRVKVVVGPAAVTARARRARGRPGPTGAAEGAAEVAAVGRAGLAPEMLLALEQADRLLGGPVPITSGYRLREEQKWLWDRRLANPYPVAPPGRSSHELGRAVDVPPEVVPRLTAVAARIGLCRPYPVRDPVHFELCRDG